MEIPRRRLALLRPVRLRLEVPLEGPYTHLLRRPAPEVEALGQGQSLVILRASRIREPAPLLPALVACYYGGKAAGQGLEPEDFQAAEWAAGILAQVKERIELRYLAVPVGHVPLPNEGWVSRLVECLSPWRETVVEAWRQRLERRLWLSVLRIYAFEPVFFPPPGPTGLQPRVRPFRVKNLAPVQADGEFAASLDELLATVEGFPRKAAAPVSGDIPGGKEGEVLQPPYPLAKMAEETGLATGQLGEWEGWLRRKKQVILYGPPGTGKTFLAERLARRLVGGTRGVVELLQFHPAYAYEDFMQGLRPCMRAGNLVYEMVPGRFMEFCARAARIPQAPCVLVLDEINRAPLSRVLGELMYLLEYRERTIPLSGGGPPFRLPENVHLIGTMNTADRSIALVDQALRRRFAFIRLRPELEVLRRALEKGGYAADSLVGVLAAINRQIGDPDHELGISFFLREKEDLRQSLPQIWKGEIEPYLEEIFYDQRDQVEPYRWEVLRAGRLADWAPDRKG